MEGREVERISLLRPETEFLEKVGNAEGGLVMLDVTGRRFSFSKRKEEHLP